MPKPEIDQMEPNKLPTRHFTHRMEGESKRAFEAAIDPFVLTAWPQNDYGLDAQVDLAKFFDGSGSANLEGKNFFVQLKAQEALKIKNGWISYSVKVNHLLYWVNYSSPVMFVLYGMDPKVCYYRWIDRELVSTLEASSPDWATQKTVTIKIAETSQINREALPSIREYVNTISKRSRRGVETGTYFTLLNRCKSILSDYRSMASPFGFKSVDESIRGIEEGMNLSIFRVAVTGLSRTGKSSLINALLGKEISPTGLFQTTGVPIQVIPGIEEKVIITFWDGRKELSVPLNQEEIKKYASQDFNPDNQLKVAMVSISVRNADLERGVSLYDIPGLDDPSDEITAYTIQTLEKVDAIIYVIDASLANNGGYIFKKEYKKTLGDLARKKDRVFVVMNKADAVQPEILAGLRSRFDQDLKKHGLSDQVYPKIFYLSAAGRVSDNEIDRVETLNDALWDYILKENKYGIWKLKKSISDVTESCRKFTGILEVRKMDDGKRKRLSASIAEINRKVPQLNTLLQSWKSNASSNGLTKIAYEKELILKVIDGLLKKIPVDNDLPNPNEIKKILLTRIEKSTQNLEVMQLKETKALARDVQSWFESNLKEINDLLANNYDSKYLDSLEVDDLTPPTDDLRSALGMGFITFVTGLLFFPTFPVALFAGMVGFFGNLFTTKESRRANKIQKIIDQTRERLDFVFDNIRVKYLDNIRQNSSHVKSTSQKYLNLYFEDLKSQISSIDVVLSDSDITLYNSIPSKIEGLQTQIHDLDAELRSYQF